MPHVPPRFLRCAQAQRAHARAVLALRPTQKHALWTSCDSLTRACAGSARARASSAATTASRCAAAALAASSCASALDSSAPSSSRSPARAAALPPARRHGRCLKRPRRYDTHCNEAQEQPCQRYTLPVISTPAPHQAASQPRRARARHGQGGHRAAASPGACTSSSRGHRVPVSRPGPPVAHRGPGAPVASTSWRCRRSAWPPSAARAAAASVSAASSSAWRARSAACSAAASLAPNRFSACAAPRGCC